MVLTDHRICRRQGVFACISPWNFPIAIFTGQIAAALAAGNYVVAKPASATPLCGSRVIELFHQAGIPAEVLHFLPGPSRALATPLLTHPVLSGVAFTGSSETAREIAKQLAARDGSLTTLTAETGGQNAMLVDRSALPEQVVVLRFRQCRTVLLCTAGVVPAGGNCRPYYPHAARSNG